MQINGTSTVAASAANPPRASATTAGTATPSAATATPSPVATAVPAAASPRTAAPTQSVASAVSTATATLATTSYSTSAGGKNYSANIAESNGTYTLTVPNVPGGTVSGSSLTAAEAALTLRIDILA